MLANLLEVESDLDRYAGDAAIEVRALLAEPLGDELTRGDALRFGAILHDMRQARDPRPSTRAASSPSSATTARAPRSSPTACARLKTSRAVSRHLQALTLHHLHLGFMTHERPLTRARLYDYLKLTAPVAADVTLLTVADRLAARGTGPTATRR